MHIFNAYYHLFDLQHFSYSTMTSADDTRSEYNGRAIVIPGMGAQSLQI